jgi:hypothetical protein
MSTDTKKSDKEAVATPPAVGAAPEKKRPQRVVVRLLRPVRGIVNNPGEVCGFSPEVAAKLLDKNRPGGACAEPYKP